MTTTCRPSSIDRICISTPRQPFTCKPIPRLSWQGIIVYHHRRMQHPLCFTGTNKIWHVSVIPLVSIESGRSTSVHLGGQMILGPTPTAQVFGMSTLDTQAYRMSELELSKAARTARSFRAFDGILMSWFHGHV